jgi:hypothetical protein
MSEVNKHGNTISRASHPKRRRYQYDFELCRASQGWVQFDTIQDASHFGVWVHPERREIITFAGGDEILVRCPTVATYHAELASMAEFYGPPPAAFTTVDAEGRLRRHYAMRLE